MKGKNVSLLILLAVSAIVSCTSKQGSPTEVLENLIPKPVSVNSTGEVFVLASTSNIYIAAENSEALKVGQYLADKLKPATGFALAVTNNTDTAAPGNIHLSLLSDSTLGEEGYTLQITKEKINLSAHMPAGLFRGIQTIRQLLPAAIEQQTVQQSKWEIATASITDYPTYAFRGSMLDVARHFFGVADVKKYIDLLAYYKMNVMHLHLSDDQGWRIEIKSWPNLTAHGGNTQVGGGNGGFYTQEQYKDIVQYAMDRYITIIPEIDMPGHTNAALASYAELNCNDTATQLYSGIEVGFSTLCTQKEITYKFVDDVIGELAAITPGPYLHIGGDESHATKIEDYIPFVSRVQEIVKAHGKQVIGWDEIALSTMQPNSIAQYWADAPNSKLAVSKGAKIIMSPASKTYMDMQYDSTTRLGLHWAAYIELDSAYSWNPATLVDSITKENIVGIEAPLWTETITNMKDIEYMVFPRLLGYAEIGWSAQEGRNWEEYKLRLAKQADRLKAMQIDYYPSALVPWAK